MIGKFKKIALVFVMLFMLTGCFGLTDDQKSPDSVALAMAKYMSSGNYGEATKLVYIGKDGYRDEKIFREYLIENKLDINGNKKTNTEKVKVDELDTTYTVKVKIDGDKILQVETIKDEDGKWYVDLGSRYYTEDFQLAVPTDAKVKINGNLLDSRYLKREYVKKSVGERTFNGEVENDVYTIPRMILGDYDVEITKDNLETIKETLPSNDYYYYSTTGNFSKIDGAYSANMSLSENLQKQVEDFTYNFMSDLYKGLNNKSDFSTLNKYLVVNENIMDYKEDYDKIIKKSDSSSSYKIDKLINFALLSIDKEEKSIYYLSDDNIVYSFKVKAKYDRYFEYIGFMAGYNTDKNKTEEIIVEYDVVLNMKKNGDSFLIKTGNRVLSSYNFY